MLQKEVERIINHLHAEFAKLQTGRANASLVESIQVDAYGQNQPLKAVAGISVQDARTIVIQPWDRAVTQAVESALNKADLGTSAVNDGTVIRINLPPMTQERRQKLTKVVQQLSEEAKISLRQQRDKLREDIKKEKDEDLRYTLLEEIDQVSQSGNEQIDTIKKSKEQEVMTV